MRFKSLLRRGICITLAAIFLVQTPLQVFAEEKQEELPEAYEGVNTEEVEEQREVSEEELLSTMATAQQEYTVPATLPIVTVPEFSQECSVQPNLSSSGRSYQVDSVTFQGTATGNNVTGIKYRLQDSSEYVAIEDYTKETENLSSEEEENPVTVDHISWTVTIPLDTLEEGKTYLPGRRVRRVHP